MDDSRNLPQPQATATGMTENTASGLSYLLGFITGIIFFVIEPRNQRVRFNAMQSILLCAAAVVIDIGLTILFIILGLLPGVGVVFAVLGGIVSLIYSLGLFVLWLLLMIKSFTGSDLRLPVIAEYADKYSKPGAI
jgi:uncharacterized membrane protein